jgi:NAD+ diphosphatase
MKLLYCPQCATELTELDRTHYRCQNGHDFWNNPKATVAVIFIKDGNVLVSKRAMEPMKGLYDLPGGYVEYGETVDDAVKREIMEETGLDVHKSRIVGSYTLEYIENVSVVDLIILAEEWSGEPQADDDSAALEWQPFTFVTSDQFGPNYPGLQQLLENIAANTL